MVYTPADILGPKFTTRKKTSPCRRGGRQVIDKQNNYVISEEVSTLKTIKWLSTWREFGVQKKEY